jgi:hypothetical protein
MGYDKFTAKLKKKSVLPADRGATRINENAL